MKTNTVYALNKRDPDAIVCPEANGKYERLTRDDFSSEEEFLRWKAWSDEDYHADENREQQNSKNVISIESIGDVTDPEAIERSEREVNARLVELLNAGMEVCLTPVERRRLTRFAVDGMKLKDIAALEGADCRRISKSILRAKEKLKQYIEKRI